MTHLFRLLLVGAALAALAVPRASAQDFDLKTINIVVGASPGGGYDAYSRLLARYYNRYLPGQPTIIVQNMPGAGSLQAVRYLDANAPKDGSVITAFNPGVILDTLLSPEKVRPKLSDVAWIGSITADLRVCYAWRASGVNNWDDLMRRSVFNIGTQQTGSSSYNNAATLQNLFGAKIKIISGYPGSTEERLAIERGELDGGCGAWSSNPPNWIAENKIAPLVKFFPGPIPNLPDNVPFAGNFLKTDDEKTILNLITGADALGRPFIASKAVPVARLEILRKGFDATLRDAQFIAEADKMQLPLVGSVTGAEATRTIERIYSAPPALVERVRQILR
jgi:tripartite-type tricarboxylate transporter receptor subunit TctC